MRVSLPVISTLKQYDVQRLQKDVLAGATVGVMVVPQALAYASIADLPLQYGLLSSWVGPLIYALLGTCKDISVGPTALMSLLVAHAVSSLSSADDRVAASLLLAFLSGILQTLGALVQGGALVRFLSSPILNGFISAAALTIGFGQLHHFVGTGSSRKSFVDDVGKGLKGIPHGIKTHWPDLVLGLALLALLFALKRMRDVYSTSRLAWVLGTARNGIVVALGTVIVVVDAAIRHGGSVPVAEHAHSPFVLTGHVPGGLSGAFRVPAFRSLRAWVSFVGPYAPIVAAVGYLESISIAKAFASKAKYRIRPSQELLAIGMANVLGSFASAYPVTGSFSRSAVNSRSGVVTPLAGIATSAIVLLAIFVLTPAFGYVPKISLACIIIGAVIPMFELHAVVELWSIRKAEAGVAVITFLACLGINIPLGIVTGLAASVSLLLYDVSHPHIRVVRDGSAGPGGGALAFVGPLFYPGVDRLEEAMVEHSAIDLDVSQMTDADATGIRLLRRLVGEGVRVVGLEEGVGGERAPLLVNV